MSTPGREAYSEKVALILLSALLSKITKALVLELASKSSKEGLSCQNWAMQLRSKLPRAVVLYVILTHLCVSIHAERNLAGLHGSECVFWIVGAYSVAGPIFFALQAHAYHDSSVSRCASPPMNISCGPYTDLITDAETYH